MKKTGNGGGRPEGVPSKRYATPKTGVVQMSEVPDPPSSERPNIAGALYQQIVALKPGVALRIDFEAEAHAKYVRGKLRALAKKEKRFLSSSRTEDNKTRFFWFEKVEPKN